MKINFFNQTREKTKEYETLLKPIFKPFDKKKIFSIIFVEKEEIQRINREYRKIDKVTDVISFALCDDPENECSEELGDIFICLERAKEQALEYGHSLEREIAFLAVHGYLHLLGYDHRNEEEEKIMFEKQEEILQKAGIGR